ncbi:GumC family protein [Spiribacter roseus]|uniref:non-specific protein-tyrosine kinase n=1 Tax=Spiribacter roseus TaxID=1855875 RepID=A0ABV3S0I5_9GAMM
MASDNRELNQVPAGQDGGDDDVIDLRQLWVTLMRHKWGIITLPLLVVMLVYLYVSTLTPIYRGTSSLLIEPDTGNVVGIQGVDSMAASREYLQTQFELLKSRGLAERVVNELGLADHPEFDPAQQEPPLIDLAVLTDWRGWITALGLDGMIPVTEPEDLNAQTLSEAQRRERIVSAFRSRVTVEPRRNTQLVDIQVEMADAATAAEAANALANGYIERQLQARLDMTEQATGWMSNRMADLKDQLDSSERRLQAYVEEQDLVDMDGVTTVEASELSQLNERLVDARQDFARAENQYQQIAGVTEANWREQATVPVVRSNSLVSEALSAESAARAKVDELSQRYGPRHPTMIEAQDELNAATETLRSQVQQVVASIEQDYELARTNLRSLESAFDDNREAIREVQQKEFRFRELEREVETNRTLYNTFLNRLKETTATADVEDANARVVDNAVVPRSPVKPRKAQISLIAGVLAFMAAIGLALLREQFDNRIRGSAEVESKLGIPMLGLLPLQKKSVERNQIARLFTRDRDKAFSEAVRTIRTGVVLSGLDNPHKIIVVTSSTPGEGKTSLASNLAASLGQMERVLLLEADMRKPTFRRIFEFDQDRPGLADVAAGNATSEQAIQSFDGIDVMACGTIPPNPLELVSSQRFTDLLEKLDQQYDRIVIDAPPVQAVSDPLVLSTHANTVIYMVKSDATPVPLVRKGLERLAEVNAPIAGIVLDHVDVKKSRKYGYGYGYGGKYGAEGYYDYYGYSSAGRS